MVGTEASFQSSRDGDRRLKWAFAIALLVHAAALGGAARLPAAVGPLSRDFEEIRVFDAVAPVVVSEVDLVEWPAETPSGTSVELAAAEPVSVEPPVTEATEQSVTERTVRAPRPAPEPVERDTPEKTAVEPRPEPEATPLPEAAESGDSASGGGGGGGSVDLGSPSPNGDTAGPPAGGTLVGELPGEGAGSGSGVGPGSGGGRGGGTGGGIGSGEGTGVGEGPDTSEGAGAGSGFSSRVADRREPAVTWKGSLEYPGSAVEDGVEGMVRLQVLVNEAGEVAEAEVIESSGDQRLDSAAIEFVAGWRYRPAVQDGTPRAVYTYARVEFLLK